MLRIGVDTGGTFTDVVLLPPGDEPIVRKLLSTPDDPARAVLEGIAAVLGSYGARFFRPASPSGNEEEAGVNTRAPGTEIVHGSTVATNALLEGKAGRAAFITTAGFEDLLWLRRQNRPELYVLEPLIMPPPVCKEDCFGVDERVGPDGTVISPLAADELDRLAQWLGNSTTGISALAVCLLHSYANPEHEQRIGSLLRARFPQLHLTVSSELLPEFREYERASTCLVNAVCAAPMLGYLGRLEKGLTVLEGAGPSAGLSPEQLQGGHSGPPLLRIMGSQGGSLPLAAIAAVPARTVLSGPAGGVLGAWHAAQAAGVKQFLSYDMGGTSTDVALCAGEPALAWHSEIAGMPLKLPLLDIHTVGAGGGSIAWVDAGGALRVGPQSLGADPGPACYGRQAAPYIPAVTDAHVVLGHIPAETRLGGSLRLDVSAARAAITTVGQQLGLATEEAALGILRVAAAEVARALRRMSVERGYDPRDFALLPFGGMGGLHATELAEQLGMRRILLPPHPGLLSALGMLTATAKYEYSQTVLTAVKAEQFSALGSADSAALWRASMGPLLEKANTALAADGIPPEQRQFRFSADLRYSGQAHEINVPLTDDLALAIEVFETQHLRLYGHNPDSRIELVTLRLDARGPEPQLQLPALGTRPLNAPPSSFALTKVWHEGQFKSWMRMERRELLADEELQGPALLVEPSATTIIPDGWTAQVLASGAAVLRRLGDVWPWPGQHEEVDAAEPIVASHAGERVDPVRLSIFRHLYSSVAEEMGARLMRSAFSPNIKERRDFSCALLDAAGQLLAQAAHIPVHLGSMPLSVQAVLATFPASAMQPGAVFVLNDPFHGGTHLPDITVVTPVFLPGETVPRFFVANRAHHADIGGISPGSMPLSRSIEEEGLRILPQQLDSACIDWICAASRTPGERRGDLQAQLAALELGRARLIELAERHGAEVCSIYGAELMDYSERCLREALVGCTPACTDDSLALDRCQACTLRTTFTDYLDDDGLGTQDIALRCQLTLTKDEAVLDLRGCDPQVLGPMNAVHAIAVSVALYCFRCLAQRLLPGTDIPENAGLLRAIRILTQPGTVVDALPPAAVAGGNVETSQRLVDVSFGALALALPDVIPAASGGSMNNITIGNDDFAYYETLACGTGGGPLRAGAGAIHTHMTNTLNTPVEALEHAYPLRVVRYALRHGSGGTGRHPGGEGIIRRYRALAPCTATLLTERRRHAPWGLAGGGAGQQGNNTFFRADGTSIELGGKATVDLRPGDELEIATPGGGGWGEV